MKRILAVILCLTSSMSIADCYVHSDIKLNRQSIIAGPTDIQKFTAPDAQGLKCVVNYRVYIKDTWHTVEGTGIGKNEKEACARSIDIGNGRIMSEIEPGKVSADMQMICNDAPEIRIRPVGVGEIIWESETDLHTVLAERKYFVYKTNKCRWFTEQTARDHNMITYQGIICTSSTLTESKWMVLDKF